MKRIVVMLTDNVGKLVYIRHSIDVGVRYKY